MWKLDYIVLLFQKAVSVINSELSLLEPGNLEHVEVRLQSIIVISGSCFCNQFHTVSLRTW